MGLGLFGKLPAKGDFITRAIPPEVLSYWEGWLEKAMGGAKHHLAAEWEPVYMASPVWRFWIGPGVFGHAMAGALTASVDRVGRQFPLTLVLSGMGRSHPVPPLSDPMEEWYGMLERALLAAKSAHFDGDVDGFLASLPMPGGAACALGEDRRNAFFAYGEHGLGQMLADVRDHDHQLAAFERSYWWTGGNDYVGPGMIAMDGMPDAAGFTAMLRGFGPPARGQQQPAAPQRPAAGGAAGTAAGTAAAPVMAGRETTVPPRDLIGDAEEAAAAAAWGVASKDELAWAAPGDAGGDAWAAGLTGEGAASPFDSPDADWDIPDARSPEPEPVPEAEPEPEPAAVPEEEAEAEEDVFAEGPEPYGLGGAGAEVDIYAGLGGEEEAGDEEPAEEQVPAGPAPVDEAAGMTEEAGPEPEAEAEAEEPGALAEEADVAEDVEDVMEDAVPAEAEETAGEVAGETAGELAGETAGTAVEEGAAEAEGADAEAAAPGAEAEAEASSGKAEPAVEDTGAEEEARPEADAGAEAEEAAAEELQEEAPGEAVPGDEESPFGTPASEDGDEDGLGRKRPGLRGLFSLRGRGKD